MTECLRYQILAEKSVIGNARGIFKKWFIKELNTGMFYYAAVRITVTNFFFFSWKKSTELVTHQSLISIGRKSAWLKKKTEIVLCAEGA